MLVINDHRSYQGNLEVVNLYMYSKTRVKRPLSKRPKIDFQDQLSLNAGQKYCRMLQREHSATLLTFIKLPFVIKIFVMPPPFILGGGGAYSITLVRSYVHTYVMPVRTKNGFLVISFENIGVLDSYFIHRYIYNHKIQVKFD